MNLINHTTLCFCLFLISAFGSSASAGQATISIVQKNGGAGNYFIAKRGNKILWKHNSWGPILRDQQSGISVLESSELLVVDRFGRIRKRLDVGAAHDPRSIFLKHGCLVYDTGALAVAVYDPKTEGLHLASWLRRVRHVHAYNVRAYHQLWEASEADIGLPISFRDDHINTLRIVNITECLQSRKATPIAALSEVAARSGLRVRSAILSIQRPAALDLMGAFLGIESVPPAVVRWTATGVQADKLFGKKYVGYTLAPEFMSSGFMNKERK